jgi:hypothetical protein
MWMIRMGRISGPGRPPTIAWRWSGERRDIG